MNTTSVPAILLLLLPGFVALQVFNSVSHKRRLSDLESLLWVLLLAFLMLGPTTVVWHWIDSDVPSVGSLIRDPQSVPIRVAAALYLLAPVLGLILGRLDRSVALERHLLRIGIDLKRRQDVWFLAFRDAYFVVVYLKSGELIYGWPLMSTTDRAGGAAELYLQSTKVWDRSVGDWKEQPDIDGIWVDASSIERIEFTTETRSSAESTG